MDILVNNNRLQSDNNRYINRKYKQMKSFKEFLPEGWTYKAPEGSVARHWQDFFAGTYFKELHIVLFARINKNQLISRCQIRNDVFGISNMQSDTIGNLCLVNILVDDFLTLRIYFNRIQNSIFCALFTEFVECNNVA